MFSRYLNLFAQPLALCFFLGAFALVGLVLGADFTPAHAAILPGDTSGTGNLLQTTVSMGLDIVFGIALPWLIWKLTGVQIASNRRETLHSAAVTGVTQAIAAMGLTPSTVKTENITAIVDGAANWIAGKGAGDTVKALGMSLPDIEAIARAKVMQVIGNGPTWTTLEPAIELAGPASASK